MSSLVDGKVLRKYFESKALLQPLFSSSDVHLFNDSGGNKVIASIDEKIQIIDVRTGQVVHSLEEEDESVSVDDEMKPAIMIMKVSENGECLISCSSDLVLKKWNIAARKLDYSWKAAHKRVVSAMDIDSTCTLLATGSSDKNIKVWDLRKRFYTHNFKTVVGLINLLKFYSNGTKFQLFSAHDDYNIRLWDLHSRSCVATFESHTSPVTNLMLMPDGERMVSVAKDGLVNVWNISNLEVVDYHNFSIEIEYGEILPSSFVKMLDFDISFSYIIICDHIGNLSIHKLEKFEKMFSTSINNDSQTCCVKNIQFLKDTSSIFLLTSDLECLVFDLEKKMTTNQFVGNLNEIIDVKHISSNEKFAVASTSENIKIFSLKDDNVFCDQILYGHKETIMSLDSTDDALFIVTGSKDKSVIVWKRVNNSYEIFATGTSHVHSLTSVRLSKTTPYLLVSGSDDLTIKLWEIEKVDACKKIVPKWTQYAHKKKVTCLALSLPQKNDSFLIASASEDKSIKIWDENGKNVSTLVGHKRSVNSLDFSPKDQILASGSTDSYIYIWSLSNYSCIKVLEGHNASVSCLQFICDGSQILSSSSDGLIKIWALQDYKCLNTLDGHDDKLWCFDTVENSGQIRIISGDASGHMTLWTDVTDVKYKEEKEREFKEIEDEQTLKNYVKEGKYSEAVIYAVGLGRSRQVYDLFQKICSEHNFDESISIIKVIFGQFSVDELSYLCGLVNEWNTNSKHFIVAQTLLKCLVESKSLEMLQNVLNIDSLLSYTDRHMKRLNKSLQDSHLMGLMAYHKKQGLTDTL